MLERQKRGLKRAGRGRKVRFINGNIRDTKRGIRGLGC
jgi:hypothetical protein